VRIRTGEQMTDNICYTDVTRKSWTSKRQTNPLDPTYIVMDSSLGEFGRKRETAALNGKYGMIAGTKPAGFRKQVAGVRNLDTQDINGA